MAKRHVEKILNIVDYQGNENLSHSKISYFSEWLSSKRKQVTKVIQDSEKREPSYMAGGNVNWCSYCAKTIKVSQNTKNRATI